MENYFNYFTEIEEHFQRRRGSLLILSTLDWALIETWKDAGIPVEAVLRGIDATFDKYDRRPVKTRKINGIGYCSQEVLAAAEDLKEAAVGSERTPEKQEAVQASEISAYLKRNATLFAKAPVPESAGKLIHEQVNTLELLAVASENGPLNLEELERRLTVMEEKLFATLLSGTPDDALVQIRAQADRDMVPYRSKMSAAQIDQLLKQYVNKKLLELYKLPRLSLFYL
ncbi:MAG TPA: hypothetical protein VFU86_21970 [Terriglobales bacterium]|nr:hypothetical protein [Terriglobales bacterium]